MTPESIDDALSPPEDLSQLEISRPSKSAAGLTGVVVSFKHALTQMGVRRSLRTLTSLNQTDGYDCQSCAWPDPERGRHRAEFCENGAKATSWEATTRRATPELFAERSIAELAALSDHELGDLGRLTAPLVRRPGATHYEAIAWDEAFALIAAELNALGSPDEAIFYTSGRTSNEAAFLYQLFVRQFGTNNLPDCSNMCHESSGTGLMETIGVGKGTVTLDDFDRAQAIFIIGQNPGTNHPRMLSTLQRAKRNGATIVGVNPLAETGLQHFRQPQEVLGLLGVGIEIADFLLRVRVGGDVALLQGIGKALLEREDGGTAVVDRLFVDMYTEGFEAYRSAVRQTSWNDIVEASGVSYDDIKRAAEVFRKSDRTITCWGMGLTQHVNGVANVQEIVNLHLMRGQVGKSGAGLCPVRGHSNVQGDRTVGVWERARPEFLDRLGATFGFTPPRQHGVDTVGAIRAMHAGQATVFFALGGNFLQATPDTKYVATALRQCRLTVHVSIKPNRAHLVTGERGLILPCLGRSERDLQANGEQFVSTENSMGIVQASRGVLDPASAQLLSEPAIVGRLARATLGSRSSVPWEELVADYDRIRDAIERVIPMFEHYNERVRVAGGFHLPNAARERLFLTDTKRARFTVHSIPDLHLEAGQLWLTTVRAHDQFNTTVYAPNDRYRGIHHGRRVVFMHPDDMRERGLAAESVVDVTSCYGGVERRAPAFRVVPYDIPRGCAAAYFPEANVLVPHDRVAAGSNTPASKAVAVTVQSAAGQTSGTDISRT